MAPHPTDATIVFIAYAGEQQGLFGSEHIARDEHARSAIIRARKP